MKKIDSVLGDVRKFEKDYEVKERRACINDIESMINSYKFNLSKPRKNSKQNDSFQ